MLWLQLDPTNSNRVVLNSRYLLLKTLSLDLALQSFAIDYFELPLFFVSPEGSKKRGSSVFIIFSSGFVDVFFSIPCHKGPAWLCDYSIQ